MPSSNQSFRTFISESCYVTKSCLAAVVAELVAGMMPNMQRWAEGGEVGSHSSPPVMLQPLSVVPSGVGSTDRPCVCNGMFVTPSAGRLTFSLLLGPALAPCWSVPFSLETQPQGKRRTRFRALLDTIAIAGGYDAGPLPNSICLEDMTQGELSLSRASAEDRAHGYFIIKAKPKVVPHRVRGIRTT